MIITKFTIELFERMSQDDIDKILRYINIIVRKYKSKMRKYHPYKLDKEERVYAEQK